MEVVRTTHHVGFAMLDISCVGEARRHATTVAQRGGMSELDAGRVALVVTELGTNLVRHAQGGQLLIAYEAEMNEIEVIALDRGPGILNVARSMGDGFSTGGTPGTGLGAVRRLADEFDVQSSLPGGTLIVARLRSARSQRARSEPPIVARGISIPLRGEQVCGDTWAVAMAGPVASLMMADGLGHGPDAAEASRAAIEVFAANPLAPPTQMLEAAHQRLRSTRGAAVTILQADASASTIRACGAGNVSARILSGDSDRTVVVQNGTAGVQIRRPQEATFPWPTHALLVVHSDGIESRWPRDALLPVLGRDPGLAAAMLIRDHSRGRDDATVAVLQRTM